MRMDLVSQLSVYGLFRFSWAVQKPIQYYSVPQLAKKIIQKKFGQFFIKNWIFTNPKVIIVFQEILQGIYFDNGADKKLKQAETLSLSLTPKKTCPMKFNSLKTTIMRLKKGQIPAQNFTCIADQIGIHIIVVSTYENNNLKLTMIATTTVVLIS